MKINKIKTGILHRGFSIRKDDIDEDARTVNLSFSSEDPVNRYFGQEILDHNPKSVVLDRLNKGGAVLLDHNTSDQVGVIVSATVGSDRKGRALVRFGKSDRASEIFEDVKDGIRQNVSVGYRIHKMRQEDSDPDKPIFRATRWEPMEVSLVSVPADTSVGIGRATEDFNFETIISTKELNAMPDDKKKDDTNRQTPAAPATPAGPTPTERAQVLADETAKARAAEQARCREIHAYGAQFNRAEAAEKAIADGTTVDDFRQQILASMADVTPVITDGVLDMTKGQVKQYSLLRALNALANPTDRRAQEAAGFEFECSREFAEKTRRAEVRGILVPPDVLQRDLLAGTDSAGGYTVGTELKTGSFIEMLRNRMVVKQAGATVLTGLVGDVAIPKQTGGATAYWLDENDSITESQQTFGQLALSPKTVAALTEFSRKLLIQSSIDIENYVKNDLAKALSIALDLACLHGTGANNQPSGVAVTSGIGSVAGGANGLAPANSHIINLETEVATDNADIGTLGYISNAKVRGKLKQVFSNATYGDIPVWAKGSAPGIGEMNGYPALVSNQVSSALTKGSSSGVCSAIFFGNWADLIIAMWAGLDLLVDPYTNSASGAVRVTAFQSADVGIRHAESFAAMLDALTT